MTEHLHDELPRRRILGMPTMVLLGALGGVLGVGALLYMRAESKTNHIALTQLPRGVTVVSAQAIPFQQENRYVGEVEPWVAANIGPQLISAYVDTVLVRPGAIAKRGEVLATLDCRDASAASKEIASEARAVDALSTAAAKEASRVSALLSGKYVSENEVDQKEGDAAAKQAQVAALKAQMMHTSLEVNDCILRSPFDGEIAIRELDPGAFAKPGASIVTVVDRHLVRVTAEVPEDDFPAVAPGTEVRLHLLATNRTLVSRIARRAPAADQVTRTTHIEIDIADPDKTIPVWTTAVLRLDVGQPTPATAVPLASAMVHAGKASVLLVQDGKANLVRAHVVGEREGVLFLDPAKVPAGSHVVLEGRNLLDNGDPVTSKLIPWTPGLKPVKTASASAPAAAPAPATTAALTPAPAAARTGAKPPSVVPASAKLSSMPKVEQ